MQKDFWFVMHVAPMFTLTGQSEAEIANKGLHRTSDSSLAGETRRCVQIMKVNLYKMHPGTILALVHLCVTTWLIASIHSQVPFLRVGSEIAEPLLVILRFPLIFLEANARSYWPPPVQTTILIAFVSVASAYLWGYSIAIGGRAVRKLVREKTNRAHNKGIENTGSIAPDSQP